MAYGVTVLVVDDDPVIVRLLQLNFELEGYTVLTARDGIEGLERARAAHPDVMLVDIMMPRMDGLAVTRALKADPATAAIPVILLSARAQASDIERGVETGADAYLTKPFDPLELLARVAEVLEGSRQ
ncbi:MAG: response regulator transcription factor [Acidimicrobiales bacterium]